MPAQAGQFPREGGPIRIVVVAQDHSGAAGERRRGGQRVGQAHAVRQQQDRRQFAPAGMPRIEARGELC